MIDCKVFLNIIIFAVISVKRSGQEIIVGFNDGVSFCPNYDNQCLRGDGMKLTKCKDGDADHMTLEGKFDAMVDHGEGDMLSIDIAKETDLGSEPMWSCTMDLCESIKDEDAPWASIFDAMNIKSCPVKKGEYKVDKLKLDTAFCKDLLNPEFIGDYEAKFEIINKTMGITSCHRMYIAVKQADD